MCADYFLLTWLLALCGVAGLNGEGLVLADLSRQHQNRGDYLETQTAGFFTGYRNLAEALSIGVWIHFWLNNFPLPLLGFHSDLEVVVAGEGNEEVEKETFAVLIDLWSVVVKT